MSSRFDYFVMRKDCFRDNNISLAAKGLLSQMYALFDEDKTITTDDIIATLREDEKTINALLKELEDSGYLSANNDNEEADNECS